MAMGMDYIALWWLGLIARVVILVLIFYGAYRLRRVIKKGR